MIQFDSRLARIDVPDLLMRLGIEARNTGSRTWEAKCPNPEHRDRSPSWFIRDQPGEDWHACHKCLSCGWSGGPVLLAQTVLGMAFEGDAKGTIEWLAMGAARPLDIALASVELVGSAKRTAVPLLELPPGAEFPMLSEWAAGPRRYLLEDRGVAPWQIERWGIGYVPPWADSKYAGRIVIPFRDVFGRLRHWTSRTWSTAPGKRYLEPSHDAGSDQDAIFGEACWSDTDTRTAVVVEGSFDALAVELALDRGVAVAALAGSSPSSRQLSKLVTRFDRLVLLKDPNAAGEALGGVFGGLGRHIEVVVSDTPGGGDPGDLAKTPEGLASLREHLMAILGSG